MSDNGKLTDLIISELEQLRTDLRTNFNELRSDIKSSNNDVNNRIEKLKTEYLQARTFWRMVGIIITLIIGSYGYTTITFANLIKMCN